MFWRFGGYANISTVDTLLDKPDVTLEELLDEPELIQELKQHNTKLIEYLREDHILKRLMDYVVAPPLVNEEEEDQEDDGDKKGGAGDKDAAAKEEGLAKSRDEILEPEDLEKAEKQRLKYAYVACEILSSETWSILESMMVNEAYLRDFWEFLKRPAPLDSLQAGYFTKVNEVLFDKKTEEMLEFFKSLQGIVPAMLQHVDNPMVMDLLLKIISLEKVEGGQGIVEWLKNENLIPILLSYLSSEHPASVQTSAGDFLKAIITISANATQNEQSCIGPNSLTRQLVSAPCVEQLISYMLQGGNALTVGVGIVIEVIRKNNSDYDPENVNGPDSPPSIYDPIYLGTLLRLFAKHIPDFMELILSDKHAVIEGGQKKMVDRGQLNSAWGTKVEPLGFDRFKACELMAELLHCSNMGLLNEVGSEDYIKQRDAERERLQQQGAFDPHRKDESLIDYNDAAGDFANGSALGSQSARDQRVLEVTNAGEDDGFEDVGSSEVPVDGAKDDVRDAKEAKETGTKPQNVSSQKSKLAINNDLVDEPLTTSDNKLDARGDAPAPSQTKSADPVSPTACGLTDKVSEIRIDAEEAVLQDSQSQPQESAASEPSTLAQQQSGNLDQTALSPHPEDTPAPLYASQAQLEPETSPTPEPVDSEHPQPSAQGLPESIGAGVAHADDEFAPQIQYDLNGQPVVGDYLKIMFVEHKVVPTILSFFFRFPWNNFLHNVVYDVVQQVFNGPMDRGFNRSLAIDLFDTGRITEQIVEGQRRSDEAQASKNMRLGYMGHLTLISEEVVKFTERHPPEVLSQTVMDKVLHRDWIDYVERTLSETRERDNAILGGVRPDIISHRQSVLNAVGATQGFTGSAALANAGLNGGGGGSSFDGFDALHQGSVSSGAFGLGGSSSLLSGFGSSSDDEDEEMEDQDDEEGRGTTEATTEGGSENASSDSTSQPIPILAPPPPPLNSGPSRARRQLAARLLSKQQAAEAAANADNSSSDSEKSSTSSGHDGDDQWQSNPFVIAGLEDDNNSSHAFPSTDFPSIGRDDALSSPTFPRTGFSPPGSPSTNSSDEAIDESTEAVNRRKVRIPLEVDDDDDEMGEMVAPSSGTDLMDSDEEEEAIINESLGYSSFFGPSRYGGFRRSYSKDGGGRSLFDDDADEHNDSSDGEDDGLVEILVPGRKSTGGS